jgi:hypothetical protein
MQNVHSPSCYDFLTVNSEAEAADVEVGRQIHRRKGTDTQPQRMGAP